MPHYPKPFFRLSRGLWYVQLRGKQINLGPDQEQAFVRYHELMAQPAPVAAAPIQPLSVLALLDKFLDWCEKNRAPDTYRWYQERLERFCNWIQPDLGIDQLRPYQVQEWIDGYPNLSSGSKRNYCRAVQRALNWCAKLGYIGQSPIAHMEKPPGGKREVVVTTKEYENVIANTRDQAFKDLLIAAWETGARPQELFAVSARHVDLENGRWVFSPTEAKGKKRPRVVYLTPKALEITLRLMRAYPIGPLFRNEDGRPWTPDATNCRFRTLKKKVGRKFCLYHLRHTWMNRLLGRGVDCLTVAILAGHSDPSTLARTYQHLCQDPGYLKKAARAISA